MLAEAIRKLLLGLAGTVLIVSLVGIFLFGPGPALSEASVVRLTSLTPFDGQIAFWSSLGGFFGSAFILSYIT